jgi:hypothetical protein
MADEKTTKKGSVRFDMSPNASQDEARGALRAAHAHLRDELRPLHDKWTVMQKKHGQELNE